MYLLVWIVAFAEVRVSQVTVSHREQHHKGLMRALSEAIKIKYVAATRRAFRVLARSILPTRSVVETGVISVVYAPSTVAGATCTSTGLPTVKGVVVLTLCVTWNIFEKQAREHEAREQDAREQ